jgi:hypothetical protein
VKDLNIRKKNDFVIIYHSLGGGLHLLTNATAVPTHHHFMTTAPVATGTSLTTATFAHTVEGKH